MKINNTEKLKKKENSQIVWSVVNGGGEDDCSHQGWRCLCKKRLVTLCVFLSDGTNQNNNFFITLRNYCQGKKAGKILKIEFFSSTFC